MMTFTAQQLVTASWFLSGIVARNLQYPTGDQLSDGLFLLNELLYFKSFQIDLIPYWTYITSIYTVPGQEFYFLENVAAVESVTFNLSVVRYPMDNQTRSIYYGAGRIDNVETLPFNWNYNRAVGGGNLALYFIPDQVYQLKIMCKQFLMNVNAQTNMYSAFDPAYVEYLRYALAQYMCSEYGTQFNPQSLAILKQIEYQLIDVSPPDLAMQKISTLTEGSGINFADVNLGRGWRPN